MPFISNSLLVELFILTVMAACVCGLALYRFFVARQQDFHLHANLDEAQYVGRQVTIASKLTWIDKWGKVLTVLTVLYFVGLLAVIFYQEWQRNSTVISN